jgi:hypothetical protein
MTTVHLPQTWTERLINLPETGMGYQKVNIVLKRGRVFKDVIVLNAEEAQVAESFDPAEILDVQLAR